MGGHLEIVSKLQISEVSAVSIMEIRWLWIKEIEYKNDSNGARSENMIVLYISKLIEERKNEINDK